MEIKVPDIGDFKDVEVIEVLVVAGQKIKKNPCWSACLALYRWRAPPRVLFCLAAATLCRFTPERHTVGHGEA